MNDNQLLSESNEFIDHEGEDLKEDNALERVECIVCQRKFIIERIERHTEACKKSKAKQDERKRIQMRKNKEKNLHHQQSQANNHKETQEKYNRNNQDSKAKWREEHEGFLEIIRYNRKIKEVQKQGGDVNMVKAPVSKVPSDYVHCEYCQRNFDPLVAERHIPKCKDIISKPKPPLKQVRQSQQDWNSRDIGKRTQTDFRQTQGLLQTQKLEDQTERKWSQMKKDEISVENNKEIQTVTNLRQNKFGIRDPKKKSIASINHEESDDSRYLTQTTMQSKGQNRTLLPSQRILQNSKNISNQNNILSKISSNQQNDGFLKTTDQGMKNLPNLKNSKYQNWTNIGFVDCITRATIISNTECPHCGRKFISRAAERHIPICEKLTKKQYTNPRRNVVSIPKQPQNQRQSGLIPNFLKEDISQIQTPKEYNQLPPKNPRQLKQLSVPKQIGVKKESCNDTFVLGGSSVAKFCTQCGTKFSIGHKYCGGCGKKRDQEILTPLQ